MLLVDGYLPRNTIGVILKEYSSSSDQGCVSHDEKQFGNIRDKEYGGAGENLLELVKGVLLKRCPVPWFSFPSEEVQGSNDVGESRDEFPVEISEASE